READLGGDRLTPAWAAAIERCASVTRKEFRVGRAVCDGVGGRLRLELRMTWLGGVRVLDRAERNRWRLMHHRPTIGARDLPLLLWRALRWPGAAA
ncbi:MAG: squalene synthase HpnC, partial [Acidobacteria bacterium]|nr:squalene synthase HpnC [Acidobacteriota bacterium]